MAGGRVYSVGYEGLTLRSFVERLRGNKVAVVFDVRMNAVSRRPGFSKRSLEAALRKAGIEYRHEPALGNPPENRDAFSSSSTVAKGRRAMRRRLDNGSRSVLEELVEEAQTKRVAVMCVERFEIACHRFVIIEAAKDIDPELDVIAMF